MSAPPTITTAERRARLAARHLLAGGAGAGGVADVCRSVVGLHSSDPVTVYLSAVRRLADPTLGAVDAALYDDRSVVRHHAMRRTLWVVAPEQMPVVHAAATAGLVAPDRRRTVQLMIASEVVDDPAAADRWIDAGIDELAAALAARGEATARELGEALPHLTAELGLATGKSYGGTVGAHTRLLLLMGFMGSALRTRPVGSWINGQYRWARTATWIGEAMPELDAAAARGALAGEYLRSFGPVTATDLQWWAGWTKGHTTAALASAGAEPVRLDDGSEAWVAPGDDGHAGAVDPWVALLPSLDPTVMGWKERDWYLDPAATGELFDRNGNAGPTVWADGRVVGAWGQRRDGSIAVELVETVPKRHARLLADEVERLRALVGDTRFTVRFQSPLGKRIAAGEAGQ